MRTTQQLINMQIFVQGQETNVYDVSPSISVGDLKELIAFRSGVSTENQVLTYAGHALEDENTLSTYDSSCYSPSKSEE